MIEIILEITLCLFVFFALYKALLEKTAMHRFKRFYLLFCLTFSLAIPFLHFETENKLVSQFASVEVMTETVIEVFTPAEPVILETATSSTFIREIPVNEVKESGNHLTTILISLYGLVTLILLVRYANGVFQIVRKAKSGKQIQYQGAKIILLQEAIVPHNFMSYIFMNRDDYSNEAFRKKLLAHELGHASQKHSVDILFIELLKVFFWFNPLYYFYGKVIRQNHEYLADQMVIKSFGDITAYQKLLLGFVKRTNQMELSLVSPSNYSLTKKRFKMMSFKTTKITQIIRIVLMTALVTITSLALSISTRATEIINDAAKEMRSKIDDSAFQEINKPDISPLIKGGVHKISSGFGMRNDPISKLRKMHHGVDFSANIGTPVIATASGMISKAGDSQNGYGLIVKINHGNELNTFYAQLSKVSVNTGDEVKRGQIIGEVGITVKSTSAHLHYEVIKNGEHVNPIEYLPSFGKNDIMVRGMPGNKDFEVMNEYDLKEDHIKKNFLFKMEYSKIVFDDSKVVLFKFNEDDPTIALTKNLTTDQIEAIHELKNPPPPPPPSPPSPAKRKPIEAIVNNWHDPAQFGIWIDGVSVSNTGMKNYAAKDFAYHWVNELKSGAKNYGKHRYQLNLQTHEKYEFDKERKAQEYETYKRETKALFNRININ